MYLRQLHIGSFVYIYKMKVVCMHFLYLLNLDYSSVWLFVISFVWLLGFFLPNLQSLPNSSCLPAFAKTQYSSHISIFSLIRYICCFLLVIAILTSFNASASYVLIEIILCKNYGTLTSFCVEMAVPCF